MRRLIFSLFVLITISFATVTVDGYAYLENQSDHSGINVIFKSRYTDTVSESVTTEENGYFTVRVETNNYFITYEKDGYFSEDVKPRGVSESALSTKRVCEVYKHKVSVRVREHKQFCTRLFFCIQHVYFSLTSFNA